MEKSTADGKGQSVLRQILSRMRAGARKMEKYRKIGKKYFSKAA